jgi:hypothetical protein
LVQFNFAQQRVDLIHGALHGSIPFAVGWELVEQSPDEA